MEKARGTVTFGKGEREPLRADPLLELFLDLSGLREAAQLLLGEDEVVPHDDLEDTAPAAYELRLNAELLLDLGRQTGGARVVVSARAVLDGDVSGHGSPSFLLNYSQRACRERCSYWMISLQDRNEVAGLLVEAYKVRAGMKSGQDRRKNFLPGTGFRQRA